jgi:hypothetical protein
MVLRLQTCIINSSGSPRQQQLICFKHENFDPTKLKYKI